jgi:hypothetical protein
VLVSCRITGTDQRIRVSCDHGFRPNAIAVNTACTTASGISATNMAREELLTTYMRATPERPHAKREPLPRARENR